MTACPSYNLDFLKSAQNAGDCDLRSQTHGCEKPCRYVFAIQLDASCSGCCKCTSWVVMLKTIVFPESKPHIILQRKGAFTQKKNSDYRCSVPHQSRLWLLDRPT